MTAMRVKEARLVLSDWLAFFRFSLISSSSQDPSVSHNSSLKNMPEKKEQNNANLFFFFIKFQVPLLALEICLKRNSYLLVIVG